MNYEKLVRDNIPEILDEKGIPYEKRVANEEEYKIELVKKLEEVREFETEHSLEELADIIEVIEALRELPEYKNVEKVRFNKLAEKGGFKNRFILKGTK
jgi:predicted house-cleaning noncanonical NTP pyrophosphatase (MazG superfamily)